MPQCWPKLECKVQLPSAPLQDLNPSGRDAAEPASVAMFHVTGGKGPILGEVWVASTMSNFILTVSIWGVSGSLTFYQTWPFDFQLKFETNLKVTAGSVEAKLAQICCNNGGALGRWLGWVTGKTRSCQSNQIKLPLGGLNWQMHRDWFGLLRNFDQVLLSRFRLPWLQHLRRIDPWLPLCGSVCALLWEQFCSHWAGTGTSFPLLETLKK